ncbi:dynein axonemal intermediate chain 3 isoform X2 [Hemicordylus capensis]|uniref:dynein axonemal intermediate chain 3 isoform X2 n=1 Tax=Hemicordylus capensis TaxID=884348 RepID=UPI0023043B63|nr:dynein axonemal intermediate chain 3 isoform X2 [Hemicordylus capensis]
MAESPEPSEPRDGGSAKKEKGPPKAKGSPKGSPKAKRSPKGSPKAKRSPKGSPKGSPKAKRSPKGSPKGKQKPSAKKDEELDLSMASMGHPEIFPLVLTEKTQEIFSCFVDVDVTAENPYKLVKKEDIIQDMKTRAAISDFHPIKKIILDYPGEELLIVFDRELKYGQIFYLVATEEAKESILNPPEPEEEEGEVKEGSQEEYVYKPPVRKPWVSLGSEKEIEEESVKESSTKIKYMISRPHKEFGIRIKFYNRNASTDKHGYVECTSYQDKNFTIRQLEKNIGIQVVPKEKVTGTQTKWTYPKNATTQYYPREFSDEEKEEYLSSDELKNFMVSVALRVEIALQQNEIMNAFFDDWKALAEDESGFAGKSDVFLKEYQSFTDLHYLKDRTVSCICWHPTIYGIVAVAVTERLTYEERVQQSGKLLLWKAPILFWSFADPIHPQLMLECPEDIYCFQFSPSDPNIIAGGCMNGQVVLWDISEYEERLQNAKTGGGGGKSTTVNMPSFMLEQQVGKEPHLVRYCAVSCIEYSHKAVITDIHWLPDTFELNRMGTVFENRAGICAQLVTCSPDCTIYFWDLRSQKPAIQASSEKKKEEKIIGVPPDVPTTFKHLDLSWRPLIKVNLSKSNTSGEFSPTKISLREEYYHTKFQDKTQPQFKAEAPIEKMPYSQIRNPSTKPPKLLENITTNFFVGTESGPLLQSSCAAKRYTVGHWSLSRAGVFFIGREDGNIDIWDLLEKTHEASQTQNVCISMITCIRPWIYSSKQHFLAVSDDFGTLHILEISWTLSHPSSNERSSVLHYFEREVKHLEFFDQRQEFRAQERIVLEQEKLMKKTKLIGGQRSRELMEEQTNQDYADFLELEKTILIRLGLLKGHDKFST